MKTAYLLIVSAALGAGGIASGVHLKNAAAPVRAGDPVAGAEPQAQARLVSDFSRFAGSEANARSLVTGLRQGTEIALAAASGQPGPATRFVPPTRPMDYGNVRIALVLAREQLDQLGITRPSPVHIKAVLAGGGVANHANGRVATPFLLPGVLQMRAGGMGWQKIAGTMGVTLVQAMTGEERQAQAAVPSDPISSASITKSSAGGPRAAPEAKPAVTARRPARPEPVRETRRSGTHVVAAADLAAAAEKIAPLPQDEAPAGTVRTPAATPAPPDDLIGTGETQAAE